MIDKNKATEIAEEYLRNWNQRLEFKLGLLKDEVQESEFGWVFFCIGEMYLETGDPSYLLAGLGPLVIDKLDASVQVFGSAFDAELCIQRYDELRKKGKATAEDVQRALKKERFPTP